MSTRSTEEKLARHRAFWSLENVDRPLIGVSAPVPVSTHFSAEPLIYQFAQEGDTLSLEQCYLADPFPEYQAYQEAWERAGQLDSDLFRPVAPLMMGLPMETAVGMSLKVAGGSIWPTFVFSEDEPLEKLRIVVRDDWVDVCVRGMDRLAEQCDGRYPIMAPLLGAPAHMVTSLLGTTRAFMEMYDHPDEMLSLIESLTDACCQIAPILQRHIPAFEGGFILSSGNGLYAPGPAVIISEDSTALMSSSAFRGFFLPADKRLSTLFPYGMVHRHSASKHNIPDLVELERNWLIQITMDPMGPRIADIMPAFHRLQEAGRQFIVAIPTDGVAEDPAEQIRAMAGELSPRGLCVHIRADSVAQATELRDLARNVRWAA